MRHANRVYCGNGEEEAVFTVLDRSLLECIDMMHGLLLRGSNYAEVLYGYGTVTEAKNACLNTDPFIYTPIPSLPCSTLMLHSSATD